MAITTINSTSVKPNRERVVIDLQIDLRKEVRTVVPPKEIKTTSKALARNSKQTLSANSISHDWKRRETLSNKNLGKKDTSR